MSIELRELERLAESHYDAMYESRYPTAEYTDANDAFLDKPLRFSTLR
jgi:hypothetical protein